MRKCADHPQPWLIGMATAVHLALLLGLRVRWPNDLGLRQKKVGGILTEVCDGVPVVGIGLNIGQTSFQPELTTIATSLVLEGMDYEPPLVIAESVVDRIAKLDFPRSWQELEPDWRSVDDTPGKVYKLSDGRQGNAIRVGNHGELVCKTASGEEHVLAADALYASFPS